MAKQFFRLYILYLGILLFVAYIGAWYDLILNEMVETCSLSGIMLTISRSFSYLFQWVLPYWWLPIIVIALVVSGVSIGMIRLIKR
jgi:hypothetical protein